MDRPNIEHEATLLHSIQTPILLRINIRPTSHMSMRARDHYTPSTLIGGKGGDGPSLLHTTLEGPTEYVNAR